MTSYAAQHKTLRDTFASHRTKSIKWRKWQLKQFWWMLADNEERLVEAVTADLNRHSFETISGEFRICKSTILDYLKNVERWAAGHKPEGAGVLVGGLSKAWLRKEPLGVALIIGAFNFPLFTLLAPALGAIAAGNCLVLKPSELASATEAVLVDIVPRYLDQSAIKVMTGGAEEVTQLLELKWDKIFYTGGSKVGRIVSLAAARHLTPVTLELGGQNPVFVGKTADVDLAAKRVAYAKFVNAGQICLSANHIFVEPSMQDKFVERLSHWNEAFTKDDNMMASMVNERHFDRVTSLLQSTQGEVAYGGTSDRSKKYIHPTVVKNVRVGDALLSEEIFGPVAPVVPTTVDDAIALVNSMPHALALYIFSNDQKEIDHILDSTTSGGVCINDLLMHVAVPGVPFNGVGESGHGAQMGVHSFEAFTHTRPVVYVPGWLETILGARYPPFDVGKLKFLAVGPGSVIGKRDQTMEEQSVGGWFS